MDGLALSIVFPIIVSVELVGDRGAELVLTIPTGPLDKGGTISNPAAMPIAANCALIDRSNGW